MENTTMTRLTRHALSLPLAAALAVALAAPVMGQDAPQETTISQIDSGAVAGLVALEGAALAQVDDEEYLFGDGTGVIKIDINTSSAEAEVPLYTLIGIEGMVASDEIDVSAWAELPIIKPAVITTEQQTIDAFWNWIITYSSQDPSLTE
jgi:uncharacterized protein YdeI (BOF family)